MRSRHVEVLRLLVAVASERNNTKKKVEDLNVDERIALAMKIQSIAEKLLPSEWRELEETLVRAALKAPV